MRRIVCVMLLFIMTASAQICQAAVAYTGKTPIPSPIKWTAAAAAVPDTAVAEITNVRWSSQVDAKGTGLMRIVFDLSGNAEATGIVTKIPTPRVILTIKGARPGKLENMAFDENVVDRANVIVNGNNTIIVLEMPDMIANSDFKVFTLPNDSAAGKSFRVVADIIKKRVADNTNANPVLDSQDSKPAGQVPVLPASLAVNPATVAKIPEITNIRWANHTDFFTGANKLRIVLEASGPIEAESTITGLPVPRLAVTIKGAAPGRIDKQLALDGKIVDKIDISSAGNNTTEMVLDLPLMIEPSDYKLFILPGDAKMDKPYRLVVDVNKKTPPMNYKFTAGLKNKFIVIDPGHGGSDSGAIGFNKTQEKVATLAVAEKLKRLLEKSGAKVAMTREDDRDVYPEGVEAADELKARTAIANNNKADVFISIHADAFNNPSAGGTTTYYYEKSGYDALLAQSIQAAIAPAGGLKDRGAKPCNFYVVKRTIMPAVLVELAFISNPAEEKLLNSPQFQLKMAQGIVEGLEQFFSQAAKQGGGQ